MGKYFMLDTPLVNIERAMTQAPSGRSHGGEVTGLCRLRYNARDPTCRRCLGHRSGDGTYKLCPYTHERPDAGTLPYGELVKRCFQGVEHTHFQNRVRDVTRKFPVFSFVDGSHVHRLAEYLDLAGNPAGTRITPWNLAALYLITAKESLWRQAEPTRGKSTIVLSPMCAKGLDVQDYALYQMAKALRRREILVSPGELSDRKLVSDETLRLIVNAVLIAICGQTVMNHMFEVKI